MKRILVNVEDRHLPLLEASGNKSKKVREALDLMLSDTPTPVINDILRGTVANYGLLKDINSKIDFLDKRLEKL